MRCCHSGARMPGRRFGSSSDRRGVLAELRREQRRRAELPHDERLHFVGIGQQQLRIRRLVHIRKPHHEPVVAPQRLDVDAGLLADLRRRRHRPRRVDASAARRQHADAPVAELVAHALDDDGRRRRERRAPRPSDRGGTAAGSRRRCASRSCSRVSRSMAAAGGSAQQVAHQAADREPELERPARRDRPSRTASCPARPAPATRARGRA